MGLVITIEAADRSADLEALRAVLAKHTPAWIETDGQGTHVVCPHPTLKNVIVGFARIFGFRAVADEPVSSHQPSSEFREWVAQETRELIRTLDLPQK